MFIHKGNEQANEGRILHEITLADSTAFTIGDAVKMSGASLALWGAGGAGLGILVGFKKADGNLVTDNGAGSAFTGTYTTPASNTVKAVVDISLSSKYSVAADAALGTTTGSDRFGVNFDCPAGSDSIDESSVQAAGTTASFFSFGADPDPLAADNSLIVCIQESQYKI